MFFPSSPSTVRSARAVTRQSGSEPFSVDHHRRNNPALILSRRQNSGTDIPLLDCRENNCCHTAAPHLTRFRLPIARSGC
jgi:hypothetical protein